MKRRVICLALCLVLVLSACLTGCKEKTTEEMMQSIVAQASADTVTLTMWVVTEQPLSNAVKASINGAVNRITTSKFNTYMLIAFLTEDEYCNVLTERIRQNEDAQNEYAPAEQIRSPWIVYGYGDENDKSDVFKKYYPGVAAHQVDIIYIAGETMYKDYIDNGWLMALDTELAGASKKINENISATLLQAAKVNNGTYAIPNNKAIGEYTYMLLDKDLADMTSLDGVYNLGKIDGFFNEYIHYYLEDIAENYEGILPIASDYDTCLDLLAHYWSINPETYEAENDALSVLGYRYTNPKTLSKGNTILSFDNLFADEVFCENLVKLKDYELSGFFGTPAEGQKAAIKFETGDFSDYARYLAEGEYYPVIVKYPSVNVKDVYDNMFGVCTYTVDLSKSMQVLTYLNTNADFRNLLQYGVEGEHYKLVETEPGNVKVERLTDENDNLLYPMNIFKTGNTFVAHPDSYMSKDVWEIAKKQNLEALIEPLLDFDFAQIVKDSAVVEEEEVKIGQKGYVYTYASGYSKEVASEHAYLKKWIDQCDATGKGVYVLHTGVIDGQNFSGKIYYYNNNIVNAKVTVTDGNGALSVNYEGTVGEGSDVTVINFNGKKVSGNLAWSASVNNTAVTTSVTYRNADVTFDFLDTKNYTVDLDTNVTKTMISDNKVVWDWITGVTADVKADSTLQDKIHVATYVSRGEEASSYTCVFYLPKIQNKYSATVHPILDQNGLSVNLNYESGTQPIEEGETAYALFILNIDVKTPITDVILNFTVDGEEVDDEKMVMDEFEKDPNVDISGTLNVGVVNYFAVINEKVRDLLDSCETIDEYKEMVAALHTLFTPISLAKVTELIGLDTEYMDLNYTGAKVFKFKEYLYKESYDALPATFKTFLSGLDGEEFYRMLASATTVDAIARYDWDPTSEVALASSTNVQVKQLVGVSNTSAHEAYYNYKSPYALYVDWLKANGYAK